MATLNDMFQSVDEKELKERQAKSQAMKKRMQMWWEFQRIIQNAYMGFLIIGSFVLVAACIKYLFHG